MRIAYGLIGTLLLVIALGSCVAGKGAMDTVIGPLLLIAGLITLFAGDILHQLRRAADTLEALHQRLQK